MKRTIGMTSVALGLSLLVACGGAPQPVQSAPDAGRRTLWGVVSQAGSEGTAAEAVTANTVPGEYLVKLRPGATAGAATLSAAGVTLERVGSVLDWGVYRARDGLSAQASRDALGALRARPDVQAAEPNGRREALAVPNDTLHFVQWDQQMINLPRAWDITTGKAVTVAVVDSGIVNHPDLAGKLLPGIDMISDVANAGDGNGPDTDPTDRGGKSGYHGAHVTGTIAAAANNGMGIAGASWGARVVPVRVLGVTGGGDDDDILRGVLWAAGYDMTGGGYPRNPNPAKVINLSLGGEGPCTNVMQEVFDTVASMGITVVVAAGNSNRDAKDFSPANCRNVITVGSVGPDGKRAPYSNFGARIDVMAPGGNSKLKVRVGDREIPGGVYSTAIDEDGDYAYVSKNGTSMASPQVAGLAALLLGENPGLTPAQVLARLKATSRPLASSDCNANACGTGLVDAHALLASNGTTPPPVDPGPSRPPVQALKTLVFALHARNGNPNDLDANRSAWEEIDASKARSLYRVRDLAPGQYVAVAWQDLNGNLDIDPGEPVGAHPRLVNLGASDAGDVNIDLAPFEANSVGNGPDRETLKAAIRATLRR